MKHLFWLLLIISLVVCSTSLANTNEEIQFNKIEWGSTYNEVVEAFPGYSFGRPTLMSPKKSTAMLSGAVSALAYDINVGCWSHGNMLSNEYSVAGYDVNDIELFFAFEPYSDGSLVMNFESTRFYLAKYIIKPLDTEAVYEDLKEKLSSIYGKADKEETDEMVVNRKLCYWYGAKDTMVALSSDDGWGNIHINYVWNRGEELLSTAYDILHQQALDQEREKIGTDNKDGL